MTTIQIVKPQISVRRSRYQQCSVRRFVFCPCVPCAAVPCVWNHIFSFQFCWQVWLLWPFFTKVWWREICERIIKVERMKCIRFLQGYSHLFHSFSLQPILYPPYQWVCLNCQWLAIFAILLIVSAIRWQPIMLLMLRRIASMVHPAMQVIWYTGIQYQRPVHIVY